MKKYLMIFTILFCTALFAQEQIVIAPIYCVDETNQEIRIEDFNSLLESSLNQMVNLNDFTITNLNVNKYEKVNSINDVKKVVELEGIDYLLYGFVQKSSMNFYAEIKFFNGKTKRIENYFFASDDLEHFERFVQSLSVNIVMYLDENFKNPNDMFYRKSNGNLVKVPFSINYWTPVDSFWFDKITGIAGISSGVEVYAFPRKVKKVYSNFSSRFNVSYNAGIGNPNNYNAFYNNVSVEIPFFAHLSFSTLSLYAGFGPVFEMNFGTKEQKYENGKLFFQNDIALEAVEGVCYELSKNIDFNFEVKEKVQCLDKPMVTLSTNVGLNYVFTK